MERDAQTVEQIIARLTQRGEPLDNPPEHPETVESIINSAIERARATASEGISNGNAGAPLNKTR